MAEDDDDFGLGDDFDDLDDFDDDDGERGKAAILCVSTKRKTSRVAYFEDLESAVAAAAKPCGDGMCVCSHAVAFRDAAGRIRIRPGPRTPHGVPQLSAALSAMMRDPRTEKRRQRRNEAKQGRTEK